MAKRNFTAPLPDPRDQPVTVSPVLGPGGQVQFRVAVDGPNVVISINLPFKAMVTTPDSARQFAAALVAAAEKAEGNEEE